MIKKKYFYDLNNFLKKDLKEPKNKNQYIFLSKFEKKKYNKLLKILSIKLNQIHKKNYSQNYWDKILGYFILFHISSCNRYFNTKIKNTKSFSKIKVKILDKKSFYVPENIKNYRKCFQHSNFGQEQLFSAIFRFIYKKKIFRNFSTRYQLKKNRIIKNKKKFSSEFLFYRFFNFIFRKIINNNYKILITKCYWPQEHKQKIQFDFKGKLVCKDFYIPQKKTLINDNLRNRVSSINELTELDSFDKFFLATLKYFLPTSILEEYELREKFTINYLNQYKKLKYIINENLDEDSMMLIAQAKQKKIKSIHSEHNFLQQQFIGNIIEFISKKFDIFLTLGWKSNNKKFKSAGSFFKWIDKGSTKKKYPIIFADGVTVHRPPFTCTAYGESGQFNSASYVNMNILFFNSLKKEILKKIWLKKYPDDSKKTFCYNPIDKKIGASKIKFVNKLEDPNIRLSNYINSAELIITNYLSTSYIQSLMTNKPTIIFFNPKSYFLNEKYHGIYKKLIRCKIMHNNPKEAAEFINHNYNNINKWWYDPKTQKARKEFVKANIKDSSNMYSVLNKVLK
jgi:putative transferase (TIGR04331 family)